MKYDISDIIDEAIKHSTDDVWRQVLAKKRHYRNRKKKR